MSTLGSGPSADSNQKAKLHGPSDLGASQAQGTSYTSLSTSAAAMRQKFFGAGAPPRLDVKGNAPKIELAPRGWKHEGPTEKAAINGGRFAAQQSFRQMVHEVGPGRARDRMAGDVVGRLGDGVEALSRRVSVVASRTSGAQQQAAMEDLLRQAENNLRVTIPRETCMAPGKAVLDPVLVGLSLRGIATEGRALAQGTSTISEAMVANVVQRKAERVERLGSDDPVQGAFSKGLLEGVSLADQVDSANRVGLNRSIQALENVAIPQPLAEALVASNVGDKGVFSSPREMVVVAAKQAGLPVAEDGVRHMNRAQIQNVLRVTLDQEPDLGDACAAFQRDMERKLAGQDLHGGPTRLEIQERVLAAMENVVAEHPELGTLPLLQEHMNLQLIAVDVDLPPLAQTISLQEVGADLAGVAPSIRDGLTFPAEGAQLAGDGWCVVGGPFTLDGAKDHSFAILQPTLDRQSVRVGVEGPDGNYKEVYRGTIEGLVARDKDLYGAARGSIRLMPMSGPDGDSEAILAREYVSREISAILKRPFASTASLAPTYADPGVVVMYGHAH